MTAILLCVFVALMLPLGAMLYLDVLQTNQEVKQEVKKVEALRRQVEQQQEVKKIETLRRQVEQQQRKEKRNE